MDFKNELRAKANNLLQKAYVLPTIEVLWEMPITIDCGQLSEVAPACYNEVLELLKRDKNRPAVYFFVFKEIYAEQHILDAINKCKAEDKYACPKTYIACGEIRKYLYCGSKKEKLHERFKQHLGFGSKTTYALHLNRWATNLGVQLEFHYAWLDGYKDYTELVESALADKIKPLVGKLV
jgi:hypothetical protein